MGVLLYDMDKINIKDSHFTPLLCGSAPGNRPISEYLKYSYISLDKPANPSSHEVVSWIKRVLNCEKTGHSGTLDPHVSGTLVVCIDRATRLTKCMQSEGKRYVCVTEFESEVDSSQFKKAIKKLTGQILQRPPIESAVKRQIRLRNINEVKVIETLGKLVLFEIDCEAGTYVRTFCTHVGLMMGVKASMKELRRIRSGRVTEDDCVTMQDVSDSIYVFRTNNDDTLIRRVFKPLENLLKGYKRIMVKDSCVGAICSGAQLTIKGVVAYDSDINMEDIIVIITTKGEAVAIATAMLTSSEIRILDHGIVCKTKRVIMEKGLYPNTWGSKKFNM